MRRKWTLGRLLAGVCLAAGCDGRAVDTDYSVLGLVAVSGTVWLDGTPLAAAVVTFEAADRTYSWARTDADGRYVLMFNSEQPGVTPGQKTVRISLFGSLGESEANIEGGQSPDDLAPGQSESPESEVVPDCYGSESGIVVEVTADSRTIDFHLDSDCSTTGPAP